MIKKNTKFLWLAAGILLLLFAVLIVVLLVKPTGLMGRPMTEKV